MKKLTVSKPPVKTDRVADAVVVVVGLTAAMMFALLYSLTPATTMAAVEHQTAQHVTQNQQ
jgi:hypothetical protein